MEWTVNGENPDRPLQDESLGVLKVSLTESGPLQNLW